LYNYLVANALNTKNQSLNWPTPLFNKISVDYIIRWKVVLAWDSRFSQTDSYSVLTDNFDILVRDSANNLLGKSDSFDNSYEIAEFDAVLGRTDDHA
jgi:hypothetical protein